MIHEKRVIVVLPAYNAAATLERTVAAIPPGVVDEIILVDDASSDETAAISRALGLTTIVHPRNRGYGGNQKTCYAAALERGADVVVMLHPDLQYDPRLVPAMASLVALDRYDVVLGTRMGDRGPVAGGMPRYKALANRALTLAENLALRRRLSEYHTGYRAYSRAALERLPLERNDDSWIFDNQILAQAVWLGLSVGEVTCPAHYPPDASSIRLWPAIGYGLGVLRTAAAFRLHAWGVRESALFAGLERGR